MGQWVRSAFEPKYIAHFLPGNGPKLALLALCEQEMSIVQ